MPIEFSCFACGATQSRRRTSRGATAALPFVRKSNCSAAAGSEHANSASDRKADEHCRKESIFRGIRILKAAAELRFPRAKPLFYPSLRN